ncbi:nnp-1 protein putative nuclear protein 1 nop52 [Anaeramoeba flamelloides]|uniref:Nnp-1 protein putative nuclear protein 1 nop52 n=1 Tax=Anaeramoeba flamelloides TaxID=1746091 RepID=A0AAV8A4V9_9EUKA|nr:nnp-1 protein putative nuclear protein 1 nop52 [Anaeramoeba flamelloides]
MFVKPNYGQEKIKSPSRPKKHPFVFSIKKMKKETNQPKENQILSWVRKLLFCPELTFEKCFCGSYLYLINLLNIISPTAYNKLATTGSRQIQREKNFNEYKRTLESCGFVSSNKLEILNLKEIREIKKNLDLQKTKKNFGLEEKKNESAKENENGNKEQQEEKESTKENENENENEMTGYSNNELIEKFDFLIQSLIYLINRYEKNGIIQERSFQFRTFYLLENMIGENISSDSDYESDLDDLFTEEQIGVYLNDSRINLKFVSDYDQNKGTFKNLYFNKPTKKKRTMSSSQLKYMSRKIKSDSYVDKHKVKDESGSRSGSRSKRGSRSQSRSKSKSKSKGKGKVVNRGKGRSKRKNKHKHKKKDQDKDKNQTKLQSEQNFNEGNILFIQQSSQSTSVITIDESWEVTTERTEESLFGDFSGLSEDEENGYNFIKKSLKRKNSKKKKKHKHKNRKRKKKIKKESETKKEEKGKRKGKMKGKGKGIVKEKEKESRNNNNNNNNNENKDEFEITSKKQKQLQTINKKSNDSQMNLKLQTGEFEFEVIDFRNPNSIYLMNNLRTILNKKNRQPETPYILENYFSLNVLNDWQNNKKKNIKSKYEFINESNDLIANCHLISKNILKIGIARFQLEISLYQKNAKKNNSTKRWYQSEMLLTKSCIIFSIPELRIKNKIKWTRHFLLYTHKVDPRAGLIESLKNKIFYRLRFESKFLKWVTFLTIIQFSMNRSNKKLFAVNPPCQSIMVEELFSNYVPLPIMPNKKFLRNYSNVSKQQINTIFHNDNDYGEYGENKNQENRENQIYQNYHDKGGVNFLISVVMNRECPIIPGHLKIRHNKLKIGVMLKTAFNISFEKNIRIFSHPISNRILRLSFDSMDLQNEGIILIALTKFERVLIFGTLLFFIEQYSKNKKNSNK